MSFFIQFYNILQVPRKALRLLSLWRIPPCAETVRFCRYILYIGASGKYFTPFLKNFYVLRRSYFTKYCYALSGSAGSALNERKKLIETDF